MSLSRKDLLQHVLAERPAHIDTTAETFGISPARLRELVAKDLWEVLRMNGDLLTTTSDDLERLFAHARKCGLDLEEPIGPVPSSTD